MREIKFRVWDGLDMWYPETLTADNNNTILNLFNPQKGIKWGLYDSVYENRVASGEHHKLMQYTGLKDKNSKEIYEGDIVKEVTVYPGKDGLTLKFEVGFELSAFHLGTRLNTGKFYGDYLLGERDNLTIIGNIHENPELLI